MFNEYLRGIAIVTAASLAACGGIEEETRDRESPQETEIEAQDALRFGGQTFACAGFLGIACPGKLQCIDDPRDDCDPWNGGADCTGMCVSDPPQPCGGPQDARCPSDTVCVEDPWLDCVAACSTGLCALADTSTY